MPKDEELHVSPEGRAVPALMLPVHESKRGMEDGSVSNKQTGPERVILWSLTVSRVAEAIAP
jgi:hypothetical protein